jgi:large subunit ribosomal protein L3
VDQWPGSLLNGKPNALLYSAIYFCMKFILARKERMTQIFDDQGIVHAGTILKTEPAVVTQVKTLEKDGYVAVQVGYEAQKAERVNKAQRATKAFKVIKEHRGEVGELAVGSAIGVDAFSAGEEVRVVGTSKGKGFQGVVKRHGFKGGPRSHGQKHSERERGSSGGGPGRAGGRVAPGMKMAGRMGGNRITVTNLKVLHVDAKAGEIIISGAVPGPRGSLVEVIAA